MQTSGTLQIRWLIRRDMPEVLNIERHSSMSPWTSDQFVTSLKLRNCIGIVAELDGQIVGFMLYLLEKDHLYVINFAVHEDHRRTGVWRQMCERLIAKLAQQRRQYIDVLIPERNVACQLCLASFGFSVVRTEKPSFSDCDEYLMRYAVASSSVESGNRISEYFEDGE